MPKSSGSGKRIKVEQKRLNKEARAAMQALQKFRQRCNAKLKPLMYSFDFEVLTEAINLARLELRNQILTMKGD